MKTVALGRGAPWLVLALEYEAALRSELTRLLPHKDGNPEGVSHAEAVEDSIAEVYARLLALADDARFETSCLRTTVLVLAREVAGLPMDEEGYELPLSENDEVELARIIAIVRTLPMPTQRIFILRKMYGYSQSEIAIRCKLPAETVQAHLVKAACACLNGLSNPEPRPRPSRLSAAWRALLQRRSEDKASPSGETPKLLDS